MFILNKEIKNFDIKDVVFISFLMFLSPIITSFQIFFSSENLEEPLHFSSQDNLKLIMYEIIIILLLFVYLKFRNFDFSQCKIEITLKSILEGIVLFLIIALIFDFYFIICNYFINFSENVDKNILINGIEMLSLRLDVSLIIISFLNGCFEEIFFLGICLNVSKKYRNKIFLYSLVIRYAFHTYQGNISAIGIGIILGTYYFLIYEKMNKRNLFPFFLSHGIADILGLSILNYF